MSYAAARSLFWRVSFELCFLTLSARAPCMRTRLDHWLPQGGWAAVAAGKVVARGGAHAREPDHLREGRRRPARTKLAV